FSSSHAPQTPHTHTLPLHDALPICFQEMGGDLLALQDQLVGGMSKRGTAHRQRARPAGAAAKADRIGVALQHPDLVERQAELLRSEEHTSELQSRFDLVCRLLLEKK